MAGRSGVSELERDHPATHPPAAVSTPTPFATRFALGDPVAGCDAFAGGCNAGAPKV